MDKPKFHSNERKFAKKYCVGLLNLLRISKMSKQVLKIKIMWAKYASEPLDDIVLLCGIKKNKHFYPTLPTFQKYKYNNID